MCIYIYIYIYKPTFESITARISVCPAVRPKKQLSMKCMLCELRVESKPDFDGKN